MKNFSFHLKYGFIAGLIQFAFNTVILVLHIPLVLWLSLIGFLIPVLFLITRVRAYHRMFPDVALSYFGAFKLLIYPLVICSMVSNAFGSLYEFYILHQLFFQLRPQKLLWILRYGNDKPFDVTMYHHPPFLLEFSWQILEDSIRFAFIGLFVAVFLKENKNKSAAE